MSRPLIQRRIDELEAMFEDEQVDPDALRLLEAELAFRSVPRATTLLAKVKRALGGGTVLPSAKQNDLFDHRTPVAVQVPLLKEAPKATAPPMPAMTLEDALKVLKITSGASWEAVELSRREAVDRARPDRLTTLSEEKRSVLKEEARRSNAAYYVLLQARSVR
jgi:DnaJ-domain-containing protein 1